MSLTYRRAFLLTAIAALLATGADLTGAELRTTACNRTICRSVSLEQEIASGPQVPIEDPLMIGKELVGSPCTGCGTTGCEMMCLPSCGRWARLEYLLWWRRGQSLPPLVTTSPDNTDRRVAGVLGQPTTAVLFGSDTVGGDARPGGRVTLGTWLDPSGCHAVEGRFYNLGQQTATYSMDSTGSPILARPFTVGATGAASARLLAFTDFTTNGVVNIRSESDVLGGDVLYRWLAARVGNTKLDFLVGYQFARMDESLSISDSLTASNVPLVDPGTTNAIEDFFGTRSEFHGGEIGVALEHYGPCWRLDFLAKIGFGNMSEEVRINGLTTTVTPPPGSTSSQQATGLLASGANLGTFSQDEFAVSPEIGLTFAYQLNECIELNAGYTFLYWSSIVQPADQIDRLLTVPTAQYAVQSGDYWLHGFTFGGEVRF